MNNAPPKNVVILTSGLAGSSVLTALLARNGYWTGDDTFKKADYDTYENIELVQLNDRLLADVGFDQPWTMCFEPHYVSDIEARLSSVDTSSAEAFVAKCRGKAPWVWKDPRLWLTIRFWQRFLDLSSTVFLLIRREMLQSWVSTTKRRQIQTMEYLKRYNDGIHETIIDFVEGCDAKYLDFVYEDLIVDPATAISAINKMLNTNLTVEDFAHVFRGRLYRRQYGIPGFLHASAIYLKNYRQRHRV